MNEKDLVKLLKASGLGQVPDETGTNVLPKQVSDLIIEDIRRANVCRRLFRSITVSGKTLSIPVIRSSTDNVYKIGHGTQVNAGGRSEVAFSTDAAVLIPKLLVAYTVMLEEDLETAVIDVARYVRQELATALAAAEEKMMLVGVKDDPSTAYTSVADGLYTIAADVDKCATTPITYSDSDDLTEKIADAVKSLGAYGEDRSKLVLLASTTFANRLRKTDKLINVNYVPAADVVSTGSLPPIAGVKIIESSYLDAKENGEVALLVRIDTPIIGDKKKISIRKKSIAESFSIMLIAAEQVDFKCVRLDANDKALGLVLIHKSGS